MDTFSFQVGAHLAARRAVLWPRLPKMAFLGQKSSFLALGQFFGDIIQKFLYHHDWTQKKTNKIVFTVLQGGILVGWGGALG